MAKQTKFEKQVENALAITQDTIIPLYNDIAVLLENGKRKIVQQANNELVLLFWRIGARINKEILGSERAEYGKFIVPTLSQYLQQYHGTAFNERNLRCMMQFAEQFPTHEIVNSLNSQLSWTHIRELLRLESIEAKRFYANEAAKHLLSVRGLRRLIERKAYERKEIANAQLTDESLVPFDSFKDPYLLDTLGLKDNFYEADLENALLVEVEKFMLEFGHGLAFVARQKRITIEKKDYYIDLLFYHRALKRLVVVELKIGDFKPSHKGQMELYLGWLNKHERQDGEEAPIGIILCSQASKTEIEILRPDKSGIAVAEFWTKMPPKEQFEKKINQLLTEAKERIARREQLGTATQPKQIEYFIESDDDE